MSFFGILEFILGNSRILCDEIPQSSWGMTEKHKSGDDTRLGNSRIPSDFT